MGAAFLTNNSGHVLDTGGFAFSAFGLILGSEEGGIGFPTPEVGNPPVTGRFGLSKFGVGLVSDDSRIGFSTFEIGKSSDNGAFGFGFCVLTVRALEFACKIPMSACRLMGRVQEKCAYLLGRTLSFWWRNLLCAR